MSSSSLLGPLLQTARMTQLRQRDGSYDQLRGLGWEQGSQVDAYGTAPLSGESLYEVRRSSLDTMASELPRLMGSSGLKLDGLDIRLRQRYLAFLRRGSGILYSFY